MAWINYNEIQDDLVTLIETATTPKLVKKEADERDYNFGNYPLVDVRLPESLPEVRAGRDYYAFTTFEIEITVHDLSGFNEAATLRDTVLQEIVELVRQNAAFSASLETSRIGRINFGNSRDENTGAFQSAVIFEVIAETFVDA